MERAQRRLQLYRIPRLHHCGQRTGWLLTEKPVAAGAAVCASDARAAMVCVLGCATPALRASAAAWSTAMGARPPPVTARAASSGGGPAPPAASDFTCGSDPVVSIGCE